MGALAWVDLVGARSIGERLFAAKRPRRTPELGPPVKLEHIQFNLRRWDGPIGDWKEHFGKAKGQVYSLDGTEPVRSCNEVEVARRLRMVRDRAFWFSEYNPTRVPDLRRPFVLSLRNQVPNWLVSLDRTIRQDVASKRGGMPDVVAWNDDEPLHSALFVECKGLREQVGEAQEDWIWAARHAGVQLSQIAVSLRPF